MDKKTKQAIVAYREAKVSRIDEVCSALRNGSMVNRGRKYYMFFNENVLVEYEQFVQRSKIVESLVALVREMVKNEFENSSDYYGNDIIIMSGKTKAEKAKVENIQAKMKKRIAHEIDSINSEVNCTIQRKLAVLKAGLGQVAND